MTTSADWSTLRRVAPRALWRVILVVAIALVVAFQARTLFVLFGGVLLAIFLKTCAELAAKHTHVPYRAAVVLLVLLHASAIGAIVVTAGPRLVEQATTLAHTLPAAVGQAIERVRHVLGASAVALPSPAELRPEPKSVVAGAQGAVTGSLQVVAGFVVIGFVGFYGALDPNAYTRAVLALVPDARKARATEVLHETSRRLGRWLVGRAVAMAFVGVTTAIGLYVMHVPLAVSLGILAGLLAFIEYIGAVVSVAPPILLAFAESPTRALGVVLLFTGVHVVDRYVLTPMLARRTVHFPPAYTLAAQTLFGALFGVIGVTFATPTCIVATALVEMLYVQDVLASRKV